MANKENKLKRKRSSENKELNYIPINKAVVNGTYAIGIGYTQLDEF